MEPVTGRGYGANRPLVNLNETEQKFSVALGAALVCVGLARTFTIRSLLLALVIPLWTQILRIEGIERLPNCGRESICRTAIGAARPV